MIFGMLSFLSFMAGGIFNAMMDSKSDLREKTILYNFCKKRGQKYLDWYNSVGGNARWNPSYPSIPFLNIWSGDFWHTSKWFMILSWTLGAVFANLSDWSWFVFLFGHGLHGFTFVYLYHYFFPTEPTGKFKDYLLRIVLFWKNAHNSARGG